MKAETLRSALGLVIIMLLCYFLQSAIFSRLFIFGVSPLILPLVAVGAGLLGSSGWGGAFGLLCGILCDAALGGGGLLFTVAMTVMGFFCGFLGDFILARGFPSYLILSLAVLLVSALLQMVRLLVFDRAPAWDLIRMGLMQTLASAIFILPLYFCLRRALRCWRRSRERTSF